MARQSGRGQNRISVPAGVELSPELSESLGFDGRVSLERGTTTVRPIPKGGVVFEVETT